VGPSKVFVSSSGGGAKAPDEGESAGLGGGGGVKKAAVGSKIGALGAGLHFNPAGEALVRVVAAFPSIRGGEEGARERAGDRRIGCL